MALEAGYAAEIGVVRRTRADIEADLVKYRARVRELEDAFDATQPDRIALTSKLGRLLTVDLRGGGIGVRPGKPGQYPFYEYDPVPLRDYLNYHFPAS